MPRLCILTQYFPPEMGAPQARLSELGSRLVAAGWDVEVLTALPNYPTGKVFDGYDPLHPVVETLAGMRVVRVPLFAAKTGFAKRLASYFSFVASARVHGPRLCERPDVLFAESPPLFIGYAARSLARHWRCPYVFNVGDLWPESAIRMGILKPGLASRLAERLELATYGSAAAVTGQSEEIIESVRRRSPGTRTQVITNGVDLGRFGPGRADGDARELLGSGPGPVFIFAGLLGYAQGIDQILDLALAWPASEPGRFVLVGEGPERARLEQRIAAERIARVRLVPAQPRERIPALLAAADVALISLGMALPGAVPSKIYEAMAASLPIVLVAGGEAARRVERAGCGLAVAPGDHAGLRTAALQVARDPSLRERLGRAGRVAAETLYNRDEIARRLDGFLRELL
jgi:glycosyltransferase involved in cell wall biosynthesis